LFEARQEKVFVPDWRRGWGEESQPCDGKFFVGGIVMISVPLVMLCDDQMAKEEAVNQKYGTGNVFRLDNFTSESIDGGSIPCHNSLHPFFLCRRSS
jgi:hypothetical protein